MRSTSDGVLYSITMENSPTQRITVTVEPSPKRRMNNEELKHKVALLEKRKEEVERNDKQPFIAREEEFKSIVEAIGDCLPILETAREERSTVWKLLNLLCSAYFGRSELKQTYQPIFDSLNRFAVSNEDWQRVEAYAEEETTADYELHAMAVRALKIVCEIEETIEFEERIFSKRRTPQKREQFIVDKFYYYGSAFGLTQGGHFFEVVVLISGLSNQEVKIGWNTCRWDYYLWNNGERYSIDEENLLQSTYDPIDDQHFIRFEGSFPIGTVLGCLLDFTERTFAFYVNGQKVIEKLTKKHPFSCNPYYVQAEGDLLYFNFGQVPFKYPPPELAACPATDLPRQIQKYALYKNVGLMPLFDNRVEPYFADEKQRKVKDTLEQLWKKGETTLENVAEKYEQLWNEETFHKETYYCRWMQAILDMENVYKEQIDDWAILVKRIFVFTMDEKWHLFNDFIVPYSKLRLTACERWSTRYATLAILFATILQSEMQKRIYSDICSFFHSYLLSAFLTITDPITAMFALIGLEADKEKIMHKLTSKEFTERLEAWKGTKWEELIDNTMKMNNSVTKLQLVIPHFKDSLLSSPAPPPAPTPTSLSPFACSSKAKLSSDCLSLRSDFKWQSACSHLAVDNSLSLAFPVFYFEVTLLTSGPMRIGWATKRWQVEDTLLGGNALSFGYDGHAGCIWHQDLQWRVKNAPKWKADDVIGCLLDLTLGKETFTFYQNGEAIQLNGDIYSRVSKKIEFLNGEKMVHVYEKNDTIKSGTPDFSLLPYNAAISLGTYQQVAVNLGHASFRFPGCYKKMTECIDYWDFKMYSQHLEEHGPNKRIKSNEISVGNVTNSLVTIDGKATAGNFSIIQSAESANPATESPFIILEPTVCQVCKQKSNYRRRTLEGCTHFAFCFDCSSKELLTCRKCQL